MKSLITQPFSFLLIYCFYNLFAPLNLQAQCTPLSGTYTLGIGGDFANFDTLTTTLNTCGVSSNTVVNVLPGIYSGRVEFGDIPGTSANATVVINGGDTSLVTVVHDTLATLLLSSTDFLTIKNITVSTQSTGRGWPIQLKDSSTNNTIDSCRVIAPYNLSGSLYGGGIVLSSSLNWFLTNGLNAINTTVTNCLIEGGEYGLCFMGDHGGNSSGVIVKNNLFRNQSLGSVFIELFHDVNVANNQLDYDLYSNENALKLRLCGDYQIEENYIKSIGDGIYILDNDSSMVNRSVILNNIIETGEAGLILFGSNKTDVIHNTVHSAGISLHALDIKNTKVKNNIFYSVNNWAFSSNDSLNSDSLNGTIGTASEVDYNVYWRQNGNANLINDGGSSYNSVSAWSANTATNLNSTHQNPVFTNVSAIDFTPLAGSISDIGDSLGVINDFYGSQRSSAHPDPGAIEFAGINNDLILSNAYLKQENGCLGSNDSLFLNISFEWGTTIDFSTDSISLYWNISGPINSVDSLVVNTGVLHATQDTIIRIGGIDMSALGSYNLTAYIKAPTHNDVLINDTLTNHYTEQVSAALEIVDDTVLVYNNNVASMLEVNSSLFHTPKVFISERSQSNATIGAPIGGRPSWLTSDDYTEFTGPSGADVSGFTYEIWKGAVLLQSTTFAQGTEIGPNGTFVIGTSQGTASPSHYFYLSSTFNNTTSLDSTGHILKDPNNNIVDAVGYGGYNFPVNSGVDSSQWSGNISSAVNSHGIKLIQPDSNSATNWTVVNNIASIVYRQNPGSLNFGIQIPANTLDSGLVWTLNNAVIDSTVQIYVGPFAQDTLLTYYASYQSICGYYIDSVVVNVSLLKYNEVITPVSCAGLQDGAISLSPSGGAGAPYSVLWLNSSGDTSMFRPNLAAGGYYPYLQDKDGNVLADSIFVQSPIPIQVQIQVDSALHCININNGTISASVSGGNSINGCSFIWNTGFSDSNITVSHLGGLSAGWYQVTVTDSLGCFASDSIHIAVNDSFSPFAIGRNLTVYLNNMGNVSVSVTDIDSASTDNCGLDTLYISQNTFSCSDLGPNTVTLTAVDASGNTAHDTVSVWVIDTFAPVIVTSVDTLYIDSLGAVTIDSSAVLNMVTDNCGIDTILFSGVGIPCTQMGFQSFNISAIDISGNITVDTISVVILDTIAPTIICNPNIVICEGVFNYTFPNAYDNCTVTLQQTGGPNNGDTLSPGNYTIELVATDPSGNQSYCTQSVNVLPAPVINLGADTSLIVGDTIHLDAGSFVSYVWSTGDSSQVLQYVAASNQLLWVTVEGQNGCQATDSILISTILNTQELNADLQLNVYPNPVTDRINFISDTPITQVNLSLYDINGKLVRQQYLEEVQQKIEVPFQIADLTSGIYMFKIQTSQSTHLFKVIKR